MKNEKLWGNLMREWGSEDRALCGCGFPWKNEAIRGWKKC
jgi:hypothetical protein